ncbi:hypothetical protein MMC20_000948 [Loxospora ochrophaea]|nr:hypothetical protein [Loxospora ochrophaea]
MLTVLQAYPDILNLLAQAVSASPTPASVTAEKQSQVYDGTPESKEDLLSMCLVCRSFNGAAIPWLYRSITLNYREKQRFELLREILMPNTASKLDKPEYNRYVHEITISSSLASAGQPGTGAVSELIDHLPALRRFVWDYPVRIPEDLLAKLSELDSVRELDIKYSLYGKLVNFPPPVLMGNAKLVGLSLDVFYHYTNEEENTILPTCQKIILQARSLRRLEVKVDSGRGGCCVADPPRHYAFDFPLDEELPPLECLVLDGYRSGYGALQASVAIENRLQISSLQHLTIRGSFQTYLEGFLQNLSTRSINLKAFCVAQMVPSVNSCETWPSVLCNFLCSFEGLAHLELENTGHSWAKLFDPIARHGRSLRTLKLYTPERKANLESSIAAKDLQCIRDNCAQLQELQLDLPREKDGFDKSVTTILREFESLRKLTIVTPLGIEKEQLVEPTLDQSYVRRVAANIWSPNLKRLSIIAGAEREKQVQAQFQSHRVPSWTNWHRVNWQVTRRGELLEGFRISEIAHTQEASELREKADFAGVDSDPPDDWAQFKRWHTGLQSDTTRKLQKRFHK